MSTTTTPAIRTAAPAIRLTDVAKTFENGFSAMQGIDLSIYPGEFVSLVGLSGCGKSTLLRVIAGLTSATNGSVDVLGSPVAGPRRDIGLMFQRSALLEWKTALENVLVPIGLHRRVKPADLAEGMRWLNLFGLAGFEHRFAPQLSGGMQQRVALARLMMTGADVRLLDEPFGAVDEFTREHLNLELLKVHEQSRSTTVLVTHSIFEAVLLSDRVIVMTSRPGSIAADIPVDLPRPRTLDMVQSADFQRIAHEVRVSLGGLVVADGSAA